MGRRERERGRGKLTAVGRRWRHAVVQLSCTHHLLGGWPHQSHGSSPARSGRTSPRLSRPVPLPLTCTLAVTRVRGTDIRATAQTAGHDLQLSVVSGGSLRRRAIWPGIPYPPHPEPCIWYPAVHLHLSPARALPCCAYRPSSPALHSSVCVPVPPPPLPPPTLRHFSVPSASFLVPPPPPPPPPSVSGCGVDETRAGSTSVAGLAFFHKPLGHLTTHFQAPCRLRLRCCSIKAAASLEEQRDI
jgi:hypothetical protein